MTGIVRSMLSTCQRAEERVRFGLERVFGGGARLLYEVQTLNKEGFEKFTKVLISNLKLLGHHAAFHAHFRPILPILEAQRSLYVCTRSIGSTADLFPTKGVRIEGFLVHRHVFSLPKVRRTHRLDVTKICNTVVNYLETAHFLIKHRIAHFSKVRAMFTSASQVVVGSREMGQIPGLHFFFQKPKEALVVFGSIWDLGEMKFARGEGASRITTLFRLAGNVGRLGLIALGRRHPHTPQFALLDATLSNMSLVSFLLDRREAKERVKHRIDG